MSKETIRARIDSDTKDKAQAIFESLGLSMSDAIRMFLKQSVLEKGLPFQVKLPNDAAHNQWFMREVEAAVREADIPGATFIPHEEMVSKWDEKRQVLLARAGEISEQ
ncbi:MAG: type II toxin-antitoxin system RelB/DinJ family antitoxin [Desulfuromonadales bacterium]|nr:type II toxin-antitoxin system RelB/DinJ family antitoxin [Desulfuromonadales bacterium]